MSGFWLGVVTGVVLTVGVLVGAAAVAVLLMRRSVEALQDPEEQIIRIHRKASP